MSPGLCHCWSTCWQVCGNTVPAPLSHDLDVPANIAGLLSQAAFVCVLCLFGIHLLIALALSLPAFATLAALAHQPVVHVMAIWCAIMALVIRAAEEGLGVQAETAGYRDYRAAVEAIRKRFAEASEPAEKFRLMEEMERLSYEEMCSFLRHTQATRFVM